MHGRKLIPGYQEVDRGTGGMLARGKDGSQNSVWNAESRAPGLPEVTTLLIQRFEAEVFDDFFGSQFGHGQLSDEQITSVGRRKITRQAVKTKGAG